MHKNCIEPRVLSILYSDYWLGNLGNLFWLLAWIRENDVAWRDKYRHLPSFTIPSVLCIQIWDRDRCKLGNGEMWESSRLFLIFPLKLNIFKEGAALICLVELAELSQQFQRFRSANFLLEASENNSALVHACSIYARYDGLFLAFFCRSNTK